jgi:hypothetical protein
MYLIEFIVWSHSFPPLHAMPIVAMVQQFVAAYRLHFVLGSLVVATEPSAAPRAIGIISSCVRVCDCSQWPRTQSMVAWHIIHTLGTLPDLLLGVVTCLMMRCSSRFSNALRATSFGYDSVTGAQNEYARKHVANVHGEWFASASSIMATTKHISSSGKPVICNAEQCQSWCNSCSYTAGATYRVTDALTCRLVVAQMPVAHRRYSAMGGQTLGTLCTLPVESSLATSSANGQCCCTATTQCDVMRGAYSEMLQLAHITTHRKRLLNDTSKRIACTQVLVSTKRQQASAMHAVIRTVHCCYTMTCRFHCSTISNVRSECNCRCAASCLHLSCVCHPLSGSSTCTLSARCTMCTACDTLSNP